jgi:SHS2 domain-containing protein
MSSKTLKWWHTEHDADIGLSALAPTRGQLFEAFAQALTAVITDPAAVNCDDSIRIHCEAPDDAMLLVDWLNALVYEMATRQMVFGEWRVTLSGMKLEALVVGEKLDRIRHEPAVEVKGATLTELAVAEDDRGEWSGHCVVDV